MLTFAPRRRAHGVRAGVIASAILLVGSVAGFNVSADATGTWPTAPTAITATASTANAGLSGPAVPDVLVAKNGPITLTVTLEPAGAAFAYPTKLKLSAELTSGLPPAGRIKPSYVYMPAGANSATFTMFYTAVDNGVTVKVSVASSPHPPTPGYTNAFDVLKALTTFAADDPRLATGLGIGNANCSQSTTERQCGILTLSNGLEPPAEGEPPTRGALSLGACTVGLNCMLGGQIVQFVGALGNQYSAESPAQLVIRCDKLLCTGKGVNSYTIKLSFAATGPLELVATPCVVKGEALGTDGSDYCVDYRTSHRDNAGDLLLYLLFTHDMRAST